jgi:hypothetical protein
MINTASSGLSHGSVGGDAGGMTIVRGEQTRHAVLPCLASGTSSDRTISSSTTTVFMEQVLENLNSSSASQEIPRIL